MGIPQACIYLSYTIELLPLQKKKWHNKLAWLGNGSVYASWSCACISQAYTWAGCEPLLATHT